MLRSAETALFQSFQGQFQAFFKGFWHFSESGVQILYIFLFDDGTCMCIDTYPYDGSQASVWFICVFVDAGAQAAWKMSPNYSPSTLPFGYFCSVPSTASVV